jgi:methionine synthase II (cobalamin-independent)
MNKITKDIYIEELVDILPDSVQYLMEEGIKCIACGEPIWGTLEEAAKEKGFDNSQITKFENDLTQLLNNKK